MSRKLLKIEVASRLVLLALVIPLASCHKTETAFGTQNVCHTGGSG